MNIAYVRVSTVEQHDDRQAKGLKENYNIDKWYREKVSGKDTNRPQLQAMLDFAREGDTIFVWDFSRLARSTKDLLEIIDGLQAKGVRVVSHKEALDTNTATGKLMLTMISAINEFERANMLERQREGIAIAKQKGKYKGRKKIEYPNNWAQVYDIWKQREITAVEAMKRTGLKKNTFYKLVKEYESDMQK